LIDFCFEPRSDELGALWAQKLQWRERRKNYVRTRHVEIEPQELTLSMKAEANAANTK
jgi:hypothetical protein